MPTLLVVYDRSESAAAAVAVAAELFPGATAVIAHVRAMGAAGAPMSATSSGAEDPAASGTRGAAQAGAEEGVALAAGAGLRATGAPAVTGRESAIGAVIAELADEHGATLIVVGAGHRSPLRAALTGTGTTGILSRSTRPVLVVPAAS